MNEEQISLFDSYDDFVEKFKPKKTTDDCYTPPEVYEAVLAWAVEEYGLAGREIVRPFYPGEDYERRAYPEGCVVVDNPPFSILHKIELSYLSRGIDFFLFAPGLSIFKNDDRLNYVICDLAIRYENGAEVPTSFVTNLGTARLQTAPELTSVINRLQKRNLQKPKYVYPDNIITAAKLRYIDGKGIKVRLGGEMLTIGKLDAQKGKSIFGKGIMVSQAAAAQAAAAQAADVIVWKLSEREKEMAARLRGGGVDGPSQKPQKQQKT